MITFRRNSLGAPTKAPTKEEVEAWSRIRENERRSIFDRGYDAESRLPLISDGSMKKAIRYDD